MKKLFHYFTILLLIVSCYDKTELYEETDFFVESLETTYQSYGAFGGLDNAKTTSDGMYKITPIGRLINVKILEVVDEEVYRELREDLEEHYKNDDRVNDVYINQGGTIMIDCRN